MTHQSGQFEPEHDHTTAGRMAEKAKELGSDALDHADDWLKPMGLSVKERPVTCLAVVGGLAFAAGALWMLRNSQQQSRMEELAQQLSDYARRSRFW